MTAFAYSDTIVALSTPPGVGALAVVRLSGPEAVSITQALFSKRNLAAQPGHTLHYGTLRDPATGQVLDEVVVALYRGPRSYTREDVVEISGHGSDFIVRQILAALLRQGARLAEAGEFTKRAFLNGALDLAQAEAVADLIAADSALSHQVALNQLRGGFSDELRDLRAQLIKFAALLELELDFGEEDVEFADRTGLARLLAEVEGVVTGLLRSFELGNVIKNGITTVIAGRPNAGKSTLLNALLREERAIVSAIPGTTRDFIEDEVSIDGLRFRFVDTAGLRDNPADEVEAIGVRRTRERIGQAALLLYLFDLTELSPAEVQADIAELTAALPLLPVLAVGNKRDLASQVSVSNYQVEISGSGDSDAKRAFVFISAAQKQGLEELQAALLTQVRGAGLATTGTATIVTNVRHARALEVAAQHLAAVRQGLAEGRGTELLAADLRHALGALGEITGEISSDDLLTSIFTQFCIGK
ncbi:tRNA uridine-5-carboxymethylaminomethyl(34) synthesis GTPase MnmE [Hymenobacter sp. UV11]|uniref:tRNA uridine-5-carboxymethylaminomethyl(34) synthesis GTPase MnmE n=1 Tax=Hymenobacter sp. UV11 TaxID=1849735 RepID=UPI00106112B4|nr:tRNA uridine-5-carboxymethylaminomethyl(34) synthesis GTPase MnmE [Hymenobacter sp. UV11]TDN40338.1 tRNA uridine(34) 5-carboxymethylaminomethyl synthesis GTPase MnmE [Hymenobacter sp. UV11]TFZ66661.1 tRNA uridine-5-carboxymethylaminomethyl(34) synthesis GTPase MnmE [Hymenobacter sp. UV11]